MKLLDTNICAGILRGKTDVVARYLENAGNVAMPAMVIGELYYGVVKSRDKVKNLGLLNEMMSVIPSVQTSDAIMLKYGELRAEMEFAGTRIDDADLIIAATALSLNATLVTGNVKHFRRFKGLMIENWFDV